MDIDDSVDKRKKSDSVNIDNSQQILKKIATLYAEKLMNDICIVVGGVEYPAHRLILCTSSEVFKVMLMNPQWSESQESRIVLQETVQCEAIFPAFLRYFYTGQIRINQSSIMGILELADKYDVKDLISLCIEYMYTHISEAAVHDQIVSWYQYTLSLAHYQLSEEKRIHADQEIWKDKENSLGKPITNQWELLRRACRNFIKWNFEIVADSEDFGNFQPEVLSTLLQQNDLVVQSEFVLYNYVMKWLEIQKLRLTTMFSEIDDVNSHLYLYLQAVMSHVRFPMMDRRQLAGLLLSPLVMQYKEFFIEKMATGVAFHEKEPNTIINDSECDRLLFTPRLYTAEQWSSNIVINHFSSLPSYFPRTLVCISPPDLRDTVIHEQTCQWVLDLYPKGLCFQKCYLIVWQGNLTIPEVVIRTVRLSITCKDPPHEGNLLVKIGILVSGVTCDVENVVEVAHCVHRFSKDDDTLHINDLLSYYKLNDKFNNLHPWGEEKILETPYLIGSDRDTLKMQITIIPLCPVLSVIDEPFNSSIKYVDI